MTTTKLTLTDQLSVLGDAEFWWGDHLTAGGMVSVGAIEGDISESITWLDNPLVATQYTGNIEHANSHRLDKVEVTLPLIVDSALWAKVSPMGSKHGGHDAPINAIYASGLLMSRSIVPTAGVSYNGTVQVPSTLLADMTATGALFMPRCRIRGSTTPRPFGNGGKATTTATVTAAYFAAGPVDKRVYVRGDPVAAGYTLFRL